MTEQGQKQRQTSSKDSYCSEKAPDKNGPGLLHCCLSTLSCREYSKLASKKLDAPLSPWEQFTYVVHRALCMVCRRYERQIQAINGAAKSYATRELETHVELSPAAKERLKEAILREASSKEA